MIKLTEDNIIISDRGYDLVDGGQTNELEIELSVPNECRNWYKLEDEEFKKQILQNQEKTEQIIHLMSCTVEESNNKLIKNNFK